MLTRNHFIGAAVAFCLLAPAGAHAGQTFLTLQHGWKTAFSFSRPSVSIVKDVVHLKGAIANVNDNTNMAPFALPQAYRPPALVYVKVSLCDGDNGRLAIHPDGTVGIEAEKTYQDADCMTSLDGATWLATTDGVTSLKLRNKWKQFGADTNPPGARLVAGMVQFQGSIYNGQTAEPFTVPKALRPSGLVYVPLDMCGATNGRMYIYPDGTTTLQAESDFKYAVCFTSLEGASYARAGDGFTALDLINGWVTYGDGTRAPAARLAGGVVQFEGALSNGTTNAAFILPASMRPAKKVSLPVDMCDSTNGRLVINPDGSASLWAENAFEEAQCFTSLEGVSFRP